MKQFLETLLEEFKELFPKQKEDKKFEQGIKNLKSFQGSLLPEREFKENLKSRLEGVYFMGTQKGGFWGNIKVWSNVAGFAFALPLMIYIGYAFFAINSQSPLVNPVGEETQRYEDQEFKEENVDMQDINESTETIKIETPSNILREADVIDSRVPAEEIFRQDDLSEAEQTIVSPKEEEVRLDESNGENSEGEVGEDAIIQSEGSKSNISSVNTGEGEEADNGDKDSSPVLQESFLPEENGGEENSDANSGDDSKSTVEGDFPVPSVPIESPGAAETSASMDGTLPSGGGGSDMADFQVICLQELGGSLIEDGLICLLPSGVTCDQAEIYSCGINEEENPPQRQEGDIYLEDYVDESQ